MTNPDSPVDESVAGFDEHHGPGVRAYLVIFAALAVFTAVSFFANFYTHPPHDYLTADESFTIILGVAVVKAALVGAYFMHLVVDWRRLYFLLVPAFILGTMMIFVLLPDIVLAWR